MTTHLTEHELYEAGVDARTVLAAMDRWEARARKWSTPLLIAATCMFLLLIAGCGTEPPRQAPVYVRDCKAAIRLVALPDGTVPTKPALCERLPGWQYDAAVLDATRPLRIKATR